MPPYPLRVFARLCFVSGLRVRHSASKVCKYIIQSSSLWTRIGSFLVFERKIKSTLSRPSPPLPMDASYSSIPILALLPSDAPYARPCTPPTLLDNIHTGKKMINFYF